MKTSTVVVMIVVAIFGLILLGATIANLFASAVGTMI